MHGQRDDASAASPTGAPSFGAAQAGSGVSSPPPHSPLPVDDQAGGGSRKAGESISSPPPPSAPPVDVQTGSQIFEAGGSSSAAARAGEQVMARLLRLRCHDLMCSLSSYSSWTKRFLVSVE